MMNIPLSKRVLPVVSVLLFGWSAAIAASDDPVHDVTDHALNHIEISGISMAMSADKIATILKAQGYTPVTGTLFTKQEQLQNQRKTIFRIEIENTAAFRQITYHRSLSGGRVKSSVEKVPIPEFERDMAQQLYQITCESIPEEVKAERLCESMEQFSISAGHGQFVDINDHFAVQLSATAANTAIGIRHSYE